MIPSRQIQRIILEADDFPSLPTTIVKVLKLTLDPNFSMKEIADLISKDAGLVTRLLKVLNSAYYGLSKNVTNIQQACSILGIRIIRNIALTLSIINIFPHKGQKEYTFLFKKSLAAGLAAELISEISNPANRSDAFISGLLHNIGMFIFLKYLPEKYIEVLNESEYRGLDIEVIEEEMLGINHLQAGALIAKRWQLPKSVIYSIEYLKSLKKLEEEDHSEHTLNIIRSAHLGRLASDIYFSWNKAYKISQFKIEMIKILNTDENSSDDILSALPNLLEETSLSLQLEFDTIPTYETILYDAQIELELLNRRYEETYRELNKTQRLLNKNEKQINLLNRQMESASRLIRNMTQR